MNPKKITITAVLLTLLISGASALQIQEGNQSMTISPGQTNSTSFNLDFENADQNVNVYAENAGQFQVFFSRSYFPDADGSASLSVQVEAPDQSNYARNISVVFDGEKSDGNTTTDFQKKRVINAKTIDPYNSLFDGWVNKTQYLSINEDRYNISAIESNLYLNDEEYRITDDSYTSIGDVRMKLRDTIPGEYAKVVAETQAEDATFEVKNIQQQKTEEKCTLFLSTRGGTTLQRGNVFYFQTVQDETGEAVGNTYVRLENSQTGNLIGKVTTDDFGYGQIQIPETLGSDNPDQTIQVVARVQKEDSNCDPTRRTLSPNTPYGDFLEDNEEYQLDLKVNKSMIKEGNPDELYGNLTGTVQTKDGESVDSGIIKIKNSDGSTNDFSFKDGTFEFQPDETGKNYQVRASKTNYADSSWYKFKYSDQCPDVEGRLEANGCLEREVNLEFYTEEDGEQQQVDPDNLEPGSTYLLQVRTEDGEIATDFNENLEVRKAESDTTKTVEFTDGQARYTMPKGEYSFDFEGTPSYADFGAGAQVGNTDGFLSGLNLFQKLGAGFLLLAIVGGIIYGVKMKSGGNSGPPRDRDVRVDSDAFTNAGGGNNVSNDDLSADVGQQN